MLKVKFWRIENIVCMKVLEQPENTRAKGEFFTHDGFALASINCPEVISPNLCCLRGDNQIWDHKVVSRSFDDIPTAKRWVEQATETIAKFNESIDHEDVTDSGEVEIIIAM